MRLRATGLALLIPALVLGCAPDRDATSEALLAGDSASVLLLVDALGDTLRLNGPAQRILSLVPSATEVLVGLGAEGALVGRTDFDDPALDHLPTVGGGLGPSLEIVRTLKPDVVVTFGGESDPRTRDGLRSFGISTFEVRPERVDDVLTMIRELGVITGRAVEAETMAAALVEELDRVRAEVEGTESLEVVYLLGGDPPWAAGTETFISDLVSIAGGRNVLDDLAARYGPVSPEVLRAREVDVILAGEGSTVDPRIGEGRRIAFVPAWVEIPGPRLGEAARLVASALRPEAGSN